MPTRKYILAIITALLMSANSGWASDYNPVALTKMLYEPYLKQDLPKQSFLERMNPYSSRELSKLLAKEDKCTTQEGICAIDFDYLINGQDYDISDSPTVTVVSANKNKQTLQAEFVNSGKKDKVTLYFVWENNAWKIDDVRPSSPHESSALKKDLQNYYTVKK